eukprot:TRINITY_DN5590_c0_g1_i7.p2 TRINITY_DN5590_c0_g1~~TRINITY_DN5590_c0_g1_i7.p2  ORF type:complete len:100 (-),score=15.77 TRINITY_DN5590_c0_g1_i7:132-407(-)
MCIFFFSSRRRHTRQESVSWARRCVQETVSHVFAKNRQHNQLKDNVHCIYNTSLHVLKLCISHLPWPQVVRQPYVQSLQPAQFFRSSTKMM